MSESKLRLLGHASASTRSRIYVPLEDGRPARRRGGKAQASRGESGNLVGSPQISPLPAQSLRTLRKMDLASKQCIPCRGGLPPLKGAPLAELHRQLVEGWEVIDEHHLAKGFKFQNFADALDYVNRIGEMAEEQGHHPDVYLAWGKVRIEIWTHKIDGLTESDFVFAAKSDRLLDPV